MKTRAIFFILPLAALAFLAINFTVLAVTGSTRVTSDGITFPDGTTQTTSSTGGYGRWSADGFKIYYNSGNVGIGTTNPGEKLEVAGNIEVSGTGNGVKFPDGTVQTTAATPTWHQKLPGATRFQLVLDSAAALDRETGLVWEKSPDTTKVNWFDAINSCYVRKVANRMGWRLSTMEELASLLDIDAWSFGSLALPPGHPFINVKLDSYFSSTTYESDALRARIVDFGTGGVGSIAKVDAGFYGWCVRGGYGHDAY